MAYERPRVKIGTDTNGKPKYTRISGKTQDERNDNIVKAYVNSGRILEFIPQWALQPASAAAQPIPEEPVKELHPFTPYAQAYYSRYKEGNRITTHGTQKGWLEQACDFLETNPLSQSTIIGFRTLSRPFRFQKAQASLAQQKAFGKS